MLLAGSYQDIAEIPEELRDGADIPEPDRFCEVLLYAIKNAHLLRYCQNPECREPYFVASRASQNFCGLACAKPAQGEAMRRWWRQHGPEWRKKRAKAKARKSQKKGGK